MSINLQLKVNKYIKAEGLNLAPYDFVLEKMLSENKLTRAEYDELMQTSIFQTPFTQAKNPDNINELWGLSLSNLPKASLVEKREPKDHLDTKIVDYVSNFNSEMENVRTFLSSIGIPLNDNYELPVKEFTADYLKSIFNEEEYEIREFGGFLISVGKKNSTESYTFAKDAKFIAKFNGSELEQDVTFTTNNRVTYFGNNEHKFILNEKLEPVFLDIISPRTNITLDKTLAIKQIDYCDNNYNVINRKISVVDELVKFKDEPNKVYELLTQEMSYDNVGTILTAFKDKTGTDLLELYSNKNDKIHISISNFIKSRFANFNFSYADRYEQKKKGEYLAEKLKAAIETNNQQAFAEAIYTLDKDSIYYALNTYRKNNDNSLQKHHTPLLPITTLIESIEVSEFQYKENHINHIIYLLNGAYLDENDSDLSDFMKQEMPKILKIRAQNGAYIKDIVDDFKEHNGDIKKQIIDFKRITQRNFSVENNDISKPNGKFDEHIKQGVTGDCWLLAGLISMYKKENGRKYLEKLVQANFSGDKVLVKLPGVNKQYEISWEEIKSSQHLVKGDGDIRALEIAIDRYIKEMSYNINFAANVDINGNSLSFFYDLLIGKTNPQKIDCVTDIFFQEDANWDKPLSDEIIAKFNAPNIFHTIAFPEQMLEDIEILKNAAINEKTGEKINLYASHAYAVIKSDEKYVYVNNPHNSEETLKIEMETLKKLPTRVGDRVLNESWKFI